MSYRWFEPTWSRTAPPGQLFRVRDGGLLYLINPPVRAEIPGFRARGPPFGGRKGGHHVHRTSQKDTSDTNAGLNRGVPR
ncbi:hypothetical protein GCM10010305_45780 [Streptomyces termitum]|uniref:Uncharacterized protein n=1 Tax=Streptomyces termitum TaxID=67368 RepID=A0A918T824_9ACTN|nr:hypothetical protein GCM10010305_45780 [Streptomyces termitum]